MTSSQRGVVNPVTSLPPSPFSLSSTRQLTSPVHQWLPHYNSSVIMAGGDVVQVCSDTDIIAMQRWNLLIYTQRRFQYKHGMRLHFWKQIYQSLLSQQHLLPNGAGPRPAIDLIWGASLPEHLRRWWRQSYSGAETWDCTVLDVRVLDVRVRLVIESSWILL